MRNSSSTEQASAASSPPLKRAQQDPLASLPLSLTTTTNILIDSHELQALIGPLASPSCRHHDSKYPARMETSYIKSTQSATDHRPSWLQDPYDTNIVININSNDGGSTGKGILIGMLSAFGSAAFVVLIFAIFYLFRYTSRGRIFLDRIGRPGEYDDEQTWARDEADALEEMDDLQRIEYLRAKGTWSHV